MASYPPPFSNDPRVQRRILRDQARMQRLQLRGMRRTSVVGPLIVIAIGVVFLLVQIGRLPVTALWLWFARWWPLLLVLFGFIRLFEWLFDQRIRVNANGVPTPQRNLGLGVTLLLVLLVIAGVASSIARNRAGHLLGHNFELNQDNLEQFLGDKHESTQTLTEACPSGTAVTINNPHGNVSVTGTSDDNQLHATISTQVFTRSDSEAAAKVRQIAAQVDRNGNQLTLTIPSISGGRSDVSITVPSGTSVTGTVNHGDIQIHSLRAALSVTANHGDIDLSSISGPVQAHINNADSSLSAHNINGPLDVEGRSLDLTLSDTHGPVSLHGDFFGTTHLERMNAPVSFHTSRTDLQFVGLSGELEITPNADLTANQIIGPVVLNTRNRNINLERVSGPLNITNRNGSITLAIAQPIAPMMIENRNGDVDITLPTNAQFNVQAETTNADLENDFGLSLTQEGERPKLIGTVGKGGPLLQVSTSQADISFRKGSIAPIPSQPPPPPLTEFPASARDSIRNAQKEAEQARQMAWDAEREGREAQKEALEEAESARKQALDAAELARKQAQASGVQARRQAQIAAEQARKQAQEEARRAHDESGDSN